MGGLTKARALRDLAVSAGIVMNIEDTWGGDIVTAAIAALAHSTPPDFLLCRYMCYKWCVFWCVLFILACCGMLTVQLLRWFSEIERLPPVGIIGDVVSAFLSSVLCLL